MCNGIIGPSAVWLEDNRAVGTAVYFLFYKVGLNEHSSSNRTCSSWLLSCWTMCAQHFNVRYMVKAGKARHFSLFFVQSNTNNGTTHTIQAIVFCYILIPVGIVVYCSC